MSRKSIRFRMLGQFLVLVVAMLVTWPAVADSNLRDVQPPWEDPTEAPVGPANGTKEPVTLIVLGAVASVVAIVGGAVAFDSWMTDNKVVARVGQECAEYHGTPRKGAWEEEDDGWGFATVLLDMVPDCTNHGCSQASANGWADDVWGQETGADCYVFGSCSQHCDEDKTYWSAVAKADNFQASSSGPKAIAPMDVAAGKNPCLVRTVSIDSLGFGMPAIAPGSVGEAGLRLITWHEYIWADGTTINDTLLVVDFGGDDVGPTASGSIGIGDLSVTHFPSGAWQATLGQFSRQDTLCVGPGKRLPSLPDSCNVHAEAQANGALVGSPTGPFITTAACDLPQDTFPECMMLDYAMPAANHCRFDAAMNISPEADMRNDPGDSICFTVRTFGEGTELATPPRMYYEMDPNPLFDPWRTTGLPTTGYVLGTPCTDEYGVEVENRWFFDLPDTAFFYPGDEIHYYAWAEDTDGFVSTLPASLDGFGNFGMISGWPSDYAVRALPSLYELTPDSQPPLLLWNDNGSRGEWDEWASTLTNLGFAKGIDVDIYQTNAPLYTQGNGLGGRATPPQLTGYDTMIYSCGDLDTRTLSNGDFEFDPAPDVELMNGWLETGDRNMYLCGANLATDLMQSGPSTGGFLTDRLSLVYAGNNVAAMIGDQTSPWVATLEGNPVFGFPDITAIPGWVTAGAPMYEMESSRNYFDAVEATGATMRLAEFTAPDLSGGMYPFAASTLTWDEAMDNYFVFQPYGFASILSSDPVGKAPVPSATRTQALEKILLYFGNPGGPGFPTPAPEVRRFTVENFPNPFNPTTTIEYFLPERGELTVRVFDARGSLVRTLVDHVIVEGKGSTKWNGRDDAGRDVPSGTYFFRAEAAGRLQGGKLTLVR